MAKVTLKIPRQKVLFDPFRTIKKIHFASGDWLMITMAIGSPSFVPPAPMQATIQTTPSVSVSIDGSGNATTTHTVPFGDEYFVTSADLKAQITLDGVSGRVVRGFSVNFHDSGINNPTQCTFFINTASFFKDASPTGTIDVTTFKDVDSGFWSNVVFQIATIKSKDMVAGLSVPNDLPFVTTVNDTDVSASASFTVNLRTLEIAGPF